MGPDQSSGGVDGTGGRNVADAHRELLQDRSLQFEFTQFKPAPPPRWLEGLAELLAATGPVLSILFWIVVAIVVLGLLYVIARSLVKARYGGLPGAGPNLGPDAAWRPTAEQARVLLADADTLAADGRFAEAAHLLLLRGVQDIRDHRPGLVRPALTSRDIAGLEALPTQARAAFGAIARIVERSFFGGRDLAADDWGRCRSAYETFALGGGA
ncbi:MAG: hypothetical protein Q8J89_03950 [Caulobacter sp.]|nr:hypothetical protein [Caulobacter sp.]